MKKVEKLGFIVQEVVAPHIIDYANLKMEEFWIVSVVEVVVTSDYSYVDIFVTSQKNQNKLPAYLSDIWWKIRAVIGKEINTRKIPIVRFRLPKIKKDTKDITDLINEISKEYGLN